MLFQVQQLQCEAEELRASRTKHADEATDEKAAAAEAEAALMAERSNAKADHAPDLTLALTLMLIR